MAGKKSCPGPRRILPPRAARPRRVTPTTPPSSSSLASALSESPVPPTFTPSPPSLISSSPLVPCSDALPPPNSTPPGHCDFTFLLLPSEVKAQIYQYCFNGQSIETHRIPKAWCFYEKPTLSAILYVNRRCYEEAVPYYRNHIGILVDTNGFGPKTFVHLPRLPMGHITLAESWFDAKPTSVMLPVLGSKFPRLRILEYRSRVMYSAIKTQDKLYTRKEEVKSSSKLREELFGDICGTNRSVRHEVDLMRNQVRKAQQQGTMRPGVKFLLTLRVFHQSPIENTKFHPHVDLGYKATLDADAARLILHCRESYEPGPPEDIVVPQLSKGEPQQGDDPA